MHLMHLRKRFTRLFAAVAVMGAMLVPAAGAGAVNVCDGLVFDSNNPTHMLYGFNHTTVNNSAGKMVVDVSSRPHGMVLFHDGHFPQYTDIVIVAGDPPTVSVVSRTTTGAIITGSPFDDIICGTVGSDWIRGRQGNDRIFGFGAGGSGGAEPGGAAENSTFDPLTGLGGDQIWGNRGNDFIVNGFHSSPAGLSDRAAFIGGGRGNDTIFGGTSSDWLRGGAANDVITVNGSGTTAFGNAGDDTLTVPAFSAINDWLIENVELHGNRGNDTLSLGRSVSSGAYGGQGNDTVLGGGPGTGPADFGSSQRLFGNAGDDVITGGAGFNQVLIGGAGNDLLTGGPTGVIGMPGDAFDYPATDAGLNRDFFNAVNPSAHQLYGSSGNNTLRANTSVVVPTMDTYGSVFMVGGLGNDTFIGGFGQDHMFGVGGNNLFNLTQADGVRDFAWGGPGNDSYLSYCDATTAFRDVAREIAPPAPGGVDSADRFDDQVTLQNRDKVLAPQLFETITNVCAAGA